MGVLDKFFRKRRASHLQNVAMDHELKHEYTEAAEAYAKEASVALADNELIFADDCIYSFNNWLKAGNIDEALNQARRALQGFMLSDWLKRDDDGEYLKELTDMVGDMQRAGHSKEADLFLTDINNALRSLDMKPVSLMVMSGDRRYPDACPHCGATMSYHGNLEEINGAFCNGVVHAI